MNRSEKIRFVATWKNKNMPAKLPVLIKQILPASKTKLFAAILEFAIFNNCISGFFSLASIKKPLHILINVSSTRDFLLTKTRNGIQR
jgi:hypothetical protein